MDRGRPDNALEYAPSGELYQGSAIRRKRKAKGIGLRQLAALIPYDAGALSKVENNRAIAPSEILEKTAKILGVDVGELAEKPRHPRLSKPTTEAIEQHITVDGKRAFEELKAEVQGLKAEMIEVKGIVLELASYLRIAPPVFEPDIEDGETHRVKRVIAAVGEGNVKAALAKFGSNPRYKLYPYWRENPASAQNWHRVITKEEKKKGNLYLLMKGFPSITVPEEQYLHQIDPLLKGKWKALIEYATEQRQECLNTFKRQLQSDEFVFIHIMPESTIKWYADNKYPSPDSWPRLLGGNEATPQQIARHLLFIVDLMEYSKGKYKVGLLEHHPADEVKLYDNVHWEVKVGHSVLMENFLSGNEQDLLIQEPSIVAAFERFFIKEMWQNFAITHQEYVKEWLTEKAYEIDPTHAARPASRG
jgi:transcriptional regulator with XRE-family HTH domain